MYVCMYVCNVCMYVMYVVHVPPSPPYNAKAKARSCAELLWLGDKRHSRGVALVVREFLIVKF